ncbi:hypothetical protein LOC71_22310 [Rhodopirellula sp. JC740]|uniref:Uncharacterized protein n=1 Tax=Rhodopirellula halodulae TaxID=2894198 RepID=A0ABS8NNB0_9BACT|nr:hypothetical protein [Rhodopirellula sp. JC740]MCC9645020.1 hypothetical protein [Rhodopirellula sp. JC740]
MKTFSDNRGQIWNLSLTLGKVRKVRDVLGLDLLNLNHSQQLQASLTDRLAYVYLLCEEQAKGLDIDADEFEERLYGKASEASQALMGESVTFFRKLGPDLEPMAMMAERCMKSMKAGSARLKEMKSSGQLDSLFKEMDEAMDKFIQQGTLPTSPESDGNG